MEDKIFQKLSDIEKLLTKHITSTEGTFKVHEEKIANHSKELWGINGTPGLKTEVDRLKTSAANLKWAIGGIVTLVGERIWSILK